MNKQEAKKQNKDRAIVGVLLAVLILAAVIAVVVLLATGGFSRRDAEPQPDAATPTEENELPVIDATGEPAEATEAQRIEIPFEIPGFTLLQEAEVGALDGSELELLGVGRYTGDYFEDGSDEPVEDVYAVVLRNNGQDWVDFAAITMSCGGRTLSFELSALPGTTSAIVLEAGRAVWTEGDVCGNPHAVITEDTATHRFDFQEDFALFPSDGVINLQNLSGKDFRNDVLVYYKNFDYGLFLGGITYLARFSGLENEEIGQSIQSHYSDARSMILYLCYDE